MSVCRDVATPMLPFFFQPTDVEVYPDVVEAVVLLSTPTISQLPTPELSPTHFASQYHFPALIPNVEVAFTQAPVVCVTRRLPSE